MKPVALIALVLAGSLVVLADPLADLRHGNPSSAVLQLGTKTSAFADQQSSVCKLELSDASDPNPGYGGRTALRGRVPSLAARSVTWLAASAFSRGQYIRVGLTSAGIRLTCTSELTCLLSDSHPQTNDTTAGVYRVTHV